MEFVSSSFFKWRLVGSLFLLLALAACQGEEIPLTRFENSPIVDSLLASAPHFVVNTDTEPERWAATTRLGLPNDSLILGRPSSMIAIGDTIYISDRQSENIFAVGADGYLSRKIGQQGQGPGEFNNLVRGLQYSGSHVFVQEMGRVHLFTETFEYVDSFFSLDYFLRRFSVSPDYVFLQCPGDPLESTWMVCARSTSPPHEWIPDIELLPRLDLPNQSGENGNVVTVTPDGDRIAMSYMRLPYIFIYDDQFRHLQTIRFEGEQIRDFHPSGFPDEVQIPAGEESFTRHFIRTMKFINSRYLVAVAPVLKNYVIDLSENDYTVARKTIFRTINDTKDIAAYDFFLHGDHLYVSSIWEEYVYGYEFEL
ncbi:MAG: 6-bladed beta-propeller [Bacteroidetes bacterium]|nr:6-bladed beta-propeller [Bacteroidota bacterium]